MMPRLQWLASIALGFCALSLAVNDGAIAPFQRLVRFKLWGAGGGSVCGAQGGAGGFVSGKVLVRLGDSFEVVVAGPGGAGNVWNPGFPNGGRGFPHGQAAGGGGSSYISLSGIVLLGAGGGGGGGSTGGGGGGSCNGKPGRGGGSGLPHDGQLGGGGYGWDGNTRYQGSCGGGNGGNSYQAGEDANGAGGGSVTCNSGGSGGGGAASCYPIFVSNCTMEDATDHRAVARDQLPPSFSNMDTPGAADTAGAVIAEDATSGEVLFAYFEPGVHTFTPDMLNTYMQEHLSGYHDCAMAGGTYNVSTAMCQPPSTPPKVPAPAMMCANQTTGFVGLDSDGSLILCPTTAHGDVHVGGTLHAAALDELRAENERLRINQEKLLDRLTRLEQLVGGGE